MYFTNWNIITAFPESSSAIRALAPELCFEIVSGALHEPPTARIATRAVPRPVQAIAASSRLLSATCGEPCRYAAAAMLIGAVQMPAWRSATRICPLGVCHPTIASPNVFTARVGLVADAPDADSATGVVQEPEAGRFAVSIAPTFDVVWTQTATALPFPSMPTFGKVEFPGGVTDVAAVQEPCSVRVDDCIA